MKLESVIISLAQATIRQLCCLMSTETDTDSVKCQLIQLCSVVQHLYRGNAEMHQVLWLFLVGTVCSKALTHSCWFLIPWQRPFCWHYVEKCRKCI